MPPDANAGFQPGQEQAQTPVTNPEPTQVTGAETQAQPQYVTPDQLKDLQTTILTEFDRRMQSMTDKTANRVGEKVREQVQNLTAIASELNRLPPGTPDTVKNKIYEQAMSSVEDVGEAAPKGVDPDIFITNLKADVLDTMIGTTLEDGDPEIQTLEHNKGPKAYLASRKAALERKLKRLAGNETSETTALPGSPAARMAGLGGGATGGIEAIHKEFRSLLDKPQKTAEDRKRIGELEKVLKEHVLKK